MSLLAQAGNNENKPARLDHIESAFHDINTPLSVIDCIAQLLELPNLTEPELRVYATKIKSNVRCAKKIISDNGALLNLAGLHSSPLELVSYLKELTDSMSALADRKNIALTFRSYCESVHTEINYLALERIMLNLVSNAVKFSGPGTNVEISLFSMHGSVIIEVRDEGCGVPESMLEAIFFRSVRLDSSQPGSGIGLSIVKNAAEALGGNVRAKNRTDRSGLSVTVEILV